MTDNIEETLGIPKEPDTVTAPEVGPDGKIIEEKPEGEGEERVLTFKGKEADAIEKMYQKMQEYTKADDDGNAVLDVERILEEEGYQKEYLVKKGSTPTFLKPEQVENEGKTVETTDDKGAGATGATGDNPSRDQLKADMKADPDKFLTDFETRMESKVNELVSKGIEPLQKNDRSRTVVDAVTNLRNTYPEFQPLEADISEYIQKQKVQINSRKDLEDVFFRVAGMKSIQSTERPGSGIGTRANTGTPRGRAAPNNPDEEADQLLSDMQSAGHTVSGVDDDTMNSLFGKTRLSPLNE